MATGPTIYQKKQAARRASADIERLARTYQTGMFDVVQQQQKGFTDWTAKTKALMEPYEASVKKYTEVDFPAYQSKMAEYQSAADTYEAQAAAYRQRLNEFNKSIENIAANPKEKVDAKVTETRGGPVFLFGGKQYSASSLPAEYSYEYTNPIPAKTIGGGHTAKVVEPGKPGYYTLYRDKPIPTFTETPPQAPSEVMPAAPTPPGAPPALPTFDTAPFQQKREELGTTFKREVGERKAAKQNVVMRRMSRSMLQGE